MHHPLSHHTPPMQEGIPEVIPGEPLRGKSVLIIVENLPVPFDRRVWQEARTLEAAGAQVAVICPKGRGFYKAHEVIDGIAIYRHPLPLEASKVGGFLVEYGAALFWQVRLAWKIWREQRFDAIHGCNPPDLIFLVALLFKPFGVKYIFDHHDIVPELFEAKFGKRGVFWRIARVLEWLTFRTADVSIATNDSYRRIAMDRGKMPPGKVHVVRSGPDLSRLRPVPPVESWKNGRAHLVGYVGVMGEQEGIELLIEAIEHVVRDKGRRDIQFCLVGDGPSLTEHRDAVAAKGLDQFVTFTGSATDQQLIEVLSTMDLGVNPDRVNTMNDLSTMNKILEYMALSKPVVQFDVTEGRFSAQGASAYAKPNDPIDFAEKLVELIDDPARRAAMGALGRERIEQELNWNRQIAPLIAAYRNALGSDNSGALPAEAEPQASHS
ncbi:glycosyltransferase family 4 protein [Altererythrobacter sp. Z27]|uniref:glycosyltransferase family 4 protein n=1 Tax=Altererythrobacter sp. Z27 TaxID=3461147 RepID=UPI0040449F4D